MCICLKALYLLDMIRLIRNASLPHAEYFGPESCLVLSPTNSEPMNQGPCCVYWTNIISGELHAAMQSKSSDLNSQKKFALMLNLVVAYFMVRILLSAWSCWSSRTGASPTARGWWCWRRGGSWCCGKESWYHWQCCGNNQGKYTIRLRRLQK